MTHDDTEDWPAEDLPDEQPTPSASRCPECGGEPLSDAVTHRLSALGYRHDDQHLVCSECGHEWPHGVPVGEFDRPDMADDLRCGSCDDAWMLVHRVRHPGDVVELHLKCPNCYYFDRIHRETDDSNLALVGYPQITGETAGCDPQGYPGANSRDETNAD